MVVQDDTKINQKGVTIRLVYAIRKKNGEKCFDKKGVIT